jgi:hypothetical protein
MYHFFQPREEYIINLLTRDSTNNIFTDTLSQLLVQATKILNHMKKL